MPGPRKGKDRSHSVTQMCDTVIFVAVVAGLAGLLFLPGFVLIRIQLHLWPLPYLQ